MNFQTIYNILAPERPPLIPISMSLLLVSVLFFLAIIWVLIRHKQLRKFATICAIVYSLSATIAVLTPDSPRYNSAQLIMKDGKYLLAEGVIKDFHPEVPWGRKVEEFTVSGVTFRYSATDLSNPGFKASGNANGPIRDGAVVRIYYYYDESRGQNIILKLDVAATVGTATP